MKGRTVPPLILLAMCAVFAAFGLSACAGRRDDAQSRAAAKAVLYSMYTVGSADKAMYQQYLAYPPSAYGGEKPEAIRRIDQKYKALISKKPDLYEGNYFSSIRFCQQNDLNLTPAGLELTEIVSERDVKQYDFTLSVRFDSLRQGTSRIDRLEGQIGTKKADGKWAVNYYRVITGFKAG